ncbi:zeta toxin family protein [Saccharibacillus sp. CPCC 101409]|uniref:AAA family ATPase n=1 Tax=Saccharibacillus sp. CPCC 101409 TaxID=3058041 RepID=UPI0026710BF3|nr:AAA family ATPase [Saccharibacillus sp. CPCC 101409]MDO3408705.1 zeta toxin family protein [Saccharibacillus sp. CPCC 101409]
MTERPVLVLLNGIPASGKSTLARVWCELQAESLPLALDIDKIRAMIGGWKTNPLEAGKAARTIAVAAVRAHLCSGRDVIVPQYLRKADFIGELEETARYANAAFVECALLIEHETAANRFSLRATFQQSGVEGELEHPMISVHAEFERFMTGRHRAVRIDANLPYAAEELDRFITIARSEKRNS